MENFFDTVLDVLKQDKRFFAEDGTFLRNAVYEAAMQMDKDLIHLLVSNNETKARFFTEVDGILVFDKVKFAWVINNREFRECKIVCVNRYCMNLLYAPYWGKQR